MWCALSGKRQANHVATLTCADATPKFLVSNRVTGTKGIQLNLSKQQRTECEAIARPVIREYVRRLALRDTRLARSHAGVVVAGDVPSALGRLASRVEHRDVTALRLSRLQQWCIDVSLALRHCDKYAAGDELANVASRTGKPIDELRARALVSTILTTRLDGRKKRGSSSFTRIVHGLYERSEGAVRLIPDEARLIYNDALVVLARLLSERGIGPELPVDPPAHRDPPIVFKRRRTARATLRVGQILHRMAHQFARRRDADGKMRERRAHHDATVAAL